MRKGFMEVVLGEKKYLMVLGKFVTEVRNAAEYELVYVIDKLDSILDITYVASLLKIPEGRVALIKTRDLCKNTMEAFEAVAGSFKKQFQKNWEEWAYRQNFMGFAREVSRYTGKPLGGLVPGDS